MADNKIEAQVTLDHKGVDVGVAAISGQMAKLDKAVTSASFRVDNGLRKSLEGLGSSVKAINFNTLVSSLNGLSSNNLFQGIGDAAKSGLKEVIQTGQGFQTAFNKVQSIARLDPEKAAAFAEQLRTINRELGIGVSPTEAAAGAYQVLSSGFTKSEDATKVLSAGLKLAKAGGADASDSLKLLAGQLNAFGLSADKATDIGDRLFQTVNSGTVEIPELANSLGRVSAAAANAGVSYDELYAIIAASTTRGVPASQVMEGLGGVIEALQHPTEESKKELASLGVTVDAITLKQKGLLGTLRLVGQAIKTRGDDNSLTKVFGGNVPRNVVSSVFDGGDFSILQKSLKASQSSSAELQKVNDIMGKGSEAASGRAKAAFQSLAVSLESQLDPALTKLANTATDFVGFLDRVPEPLKNIGLVAAITAGGLSIFGGIAIAVGTGLVNLIGAVRNLGLKMPALGGATSQASKDLAEFYKQQSLIQGVTRNSNSLFGLALTSTNAYALAIGGLGLAALGTAKAFADLAIQNEEYNLQLAKADRGDSENFGKGITDGTSGQRISTQQAIGSSASDLADLGLTGKDLDSEAARNRNRISTLRAKAEELNSQDNTTEAKKFTEEADYLQKTLGDLKKRADELDAENAKRQAKSDPEVQRQARELSKKEGDDKYKDELQAIELSKAGHREKIEQLNVLLLRYQDDGDKRRQIEREIYQEQKQLDKQRSDDAKKKTQEKLKEQFQKIDNRSGDEQQRIADLQKLKKQYADNGDARRAIEDRIFKLEEQYQKKREDNIQRLADLKEQAAQDEITRSQARQGDLEKLSGRGADTSGLQQAELEKQAKLEKDAIKAQLEKDLANKDLTPEVRKKLKSEAKGRQDDVDRDLERKQTDLRQNTDLQKNSDETSSVQKERSLGDLKINILKAQQEAGKDVQSQLKQAILDRLALQEREIALQVESVRQQTDDPRKIAQAERDAQGQILEARRAANDEILKGTEALKAQKAAKDQLNGGEFSGRIQTLDQFIQGENERFKFKPGLGSGPKVVPGIDLKGAERDVLNQKRLSPEALRGDGGVTVVPVGGKFVVEVINKGSGDKLDAKLKEVTLDGRGSKSEKAGRGLSGRYGLGG